MDHTEGEHTKVPEVREEGREVIDRQECVGCEHFVPDKDVPRCLFDGLCIYNMLRHDGKPFGYTTPEDRMEPHERR